MSDPIEPRPTRPLIESYSYHSPLPDWLLQDRLDQDEKGIKDENEEGWMLGIDEAGRGREFARIPQFDMVTKDEELADSSFDIWATQQPSSDRWSTLRHIVR
jgi:hypothetical protein